MRIYFESLVHLQQCVEKLLYDFDIEQEIAQNICARMCGYNDWSELRQVTENSTHATSLPDEMCSHVVSRTRYLFQLRQFILACIEFKLEASSEAITECLNRLRPSAGFLPGAYQYADIIDKLFPPTTDLVLEPETPIDKAKDLGSIGGNQANAFIESTSQVFLPNLDTRLGLRTYEFQLPHLGTLASAIIIFSVNITVEQNVIAKVTITLLDGFCEEDAVSFAAGGFLCYLKNLNDLNIDLGEVTLPYDGVTLEIIDSTNQTELEIFIETLDGALESSFIQSKEGAYSYLNPPSNTESFPVPEYFRISSYSVLSQFSHLNEREDLEVHRLERMRQMIAGFFPEIPTSLASHLVLNGKEDLADFAAALPLKNVDDFKPFIKFVTSLKSAIAITESQFILINHLLHQAYVDFVFGDDRDEICVEDGGKNPHFVYVAKLMESEAMEKLYRTKDVTEILSVSKRGIAEFERERQVVEDE